MDGQSLRAIMGDKPFSFHYADHNLMIPALLKRKPTEKQIADMHRLRKEARSLLRPRGCVRARETKPYFWRAASLWLHAVVEAGLRMGRGEKVNLNAELISPECAADMSRLARLSPNDPKTIGVAMFLELMACILHDKMDFSGVENAIAGGRVAKKPSVVECLPAASREFVRWAMNRLEELATASEKNTAAEACEMLADVLLLLDVRGKVEYGLPYRFSENDQKKTMAKFLNLLRRTVELDPSRTNGLGLVDDVPGRAEEYRGSHRRGPQADRRER